MVSCNVLVPQLFWFRKIRENLLVVWILSIFINIGMWFERFVIIVTSLHRDFLPSSWSYYVPTKIEIATLLGSFGLFFTLFLLFCRFLPVIAMGEIKGVLGYGRAKGGWHHESKTARCLPAGRGNHLGHAVLPRPGIRDHRRLHAVSGAWPRAGHGAQAVADPLRLPLPSPSSARR